MNAHSLRVLEFEKVRETLVERAAAAGGARRLHEITPSRDPGEVSRRLRCVSEVRRVLEDSDLPIHGLPDLETSLDEAEPAGAVLAGARIAPVARSLHVVKRLKAFLHERRETLEELGEVARPLESLAELREGIDRQLDPEGRVRDSASPAIRRVRNEQERVRSRILGLLQKTVRSLSGSGSDPVVTVRNDRHLIQVTRERLGSLKGVVHAQSGSGASVYLEPTSVVPHNNELAELRSAEEEEVRRILAELTDRIRAVLVPLRANEEALAELDTHYAAGKLSRDLAAIPALPSPHGGIEIRKGRHPLLQMAHAASGDPVVPLDLGLGGRRAQTLVITGPNTGGKTVALKTVGLFVVMNQCGLHVPAGEGTELPVLDDIFADIGDEQSIEASLSTFSSHLSHIKDGLEAAGASTLVLLDEIGVGTDPEEGAALAKSILGALTRREALTIVTTHYGSLKVFAHDTDGMENASLEFDRESLAPTYRFQQGVPGSSEALAIAARLGLPADIVDEARALVGGEKEAVEGLLHDLQERRKSLDEMKTELERELTAARDAKERAEGRLAGLRDEKARIKRDAMEEARRLVERSKAELSEILGAVKADGVSGKASGRARTRLGEMGKELDRGLVAEEAFAEPAHPARPDEVRDGTPVLISRMGWKGTALGEPGANGKVSVAVGSLRVEVPVEALQVRDGGTEKPRERAPSVVKRPEGIATSELDLRGRTVEEAVQEVDRTLDGVVLAGGTWLRIIHGKGTGALRSAITEQLENDERVKSFRLGEPAEGGSGVTIAVLK
jgi:DNA mismatch repair protein MutS2